MSIEVSVVTPTYNRRKFIPNLIEIYKNQTYPKEKMEWIIMDDGKDKVEDLFEEASKIVPNIRYFYYDEKLRIGAKRNLLNKEARGKIIVAMDDDDYYPPERVQSVVDGFSKYPRVELAGCSEMYLYYHDIKKIYVIGPYHPNHATNGTMAWKKSYSDKYKYNEFVTHAEEVSFLNDYKFPMIQLDPKKTILVICHSDNTVDKNEIREEHKSNPMSKYKLKETNHKLKDFVKDKNIQEFYLNLA